MPSRFIRQANVEDLPILHHIRMSVKENILSNPDLVTAQDYIDMTAKHGKGWVYEDAEIRGFAFVDLRDNNIWALFVDPVSEKQGIGRALHDAMIDWCRSNGIKNLWLTTDGNTRAESFYRKAGWKQTGIQPNGELRFALEL